MKTLFTILLLLTAEITFGQSENGRAITQQVISYPILDTLPEQIIESNWETYIVNKVPILDTTPEVIITFNWETFIDSVVNRKGYFQDAIDVPTNVTNFDNNLSSADTDVQKALETIDEMSVGGVTSVGFNGGTGFDISGSPITGSGSFTFTQDFSEFTDITESTGMKFIVTNPSEREIAIGDVDLSDFNNDLGVGTSVNFGIDEQIPYMNAAGNDFIYSADFTFNGTALEIGSGTTPRPIKLEPNTGLIWLPTFAGSVFSVTGYGGFWGRATGGIPMWTNTTDTYSFDLTSTSDFWKKKDFKLIDSPLNKILALQAYQFNWKYDYPDKQPTDSINVILCNDNKLREATGFIAQEAKKIVPEIVSEVDDSGYLQIDYDALVPYLVEAIKEQQKQIDELRKLIEEKIN